jgi:aspartate aminotransferase-like enzyme
MEVEEGLKYVFQTQNDVIIFPSSGTGAMEAAVVNLVSPDDRVLVATCGVFGDRWVKILSSYGVKPDVLNVEWGNPIPPEDLGRRAVEGGAKVVFTTLTETSTGVTNDVKGFADVLKGKDSILVVDAISGLGATELLQDEWGVDVVVAGSQKGLMLPPGLSFISMSERAWTVAKDSRLPKFYWDLFEMRRRFEEGGAYTPAISLIMALRESIKLIRTEGLENVIGRHARLAAATRAAVQAMGLKLFAPNGNCNSVTSVWLPEGIDGSALTRMMDRRYGVTIAGGQGILKGKIFRIGHLGFVDEVDLLGSLAALEMVLLKLGFGLELGVGVRAAQEVLMKGGTA